MTSEKVSVERHGPGSYDISIANVIWNANYIQELKQWTAYNINDPNLTLGPKSTLKEIIILAELEAHHD